MKWHGLSSSARLLPWFAVTCLVATALPVWARLTIVLPGAPTITQSYAVDELGKYLHDITGEQVRVWPDLPAWGELDGWRKLDEPVFLVGDTRFSRDLKARCKEQSPKAYCLHSEGNVLFLVGATERATLYAVYEYLSSLGCRWLIPGRAGEIIPKLERLPAFDLDEVHKPANSRRDMADFNDIEPYVIPWLVRNRVNSAAAQSQMDFSWGPLIKHYWDQRGGAVLTRYHGHSYAQLVPKALFDTHPDWFALIDGKRSTTGDDAYWNTQFATQFCTSNPDAVQHVIDTVDRFFTANPEYEAFGLTPIDGGPWCECEACRAQDRPPGGHAGRVIALANAVASAIETKHPGKEILVLAYADRYLEPPEGLTIHANVRVQVCLWPSFLQPITGPQTEEGAYYFEQFKGWAARKCLLGTWLYALYSAQTPYDLSIRAMALNARTYRDMGADYVLHECGGDRSWQRIPMATWCWMRLAWDPDSDWRALIGDFCKSFYGVAGEAVRDVFLLIEDRLEQTGALRKEDVYTVDFVGQIKPRLQGALDQATTPESKGRVQALVDMLPDPVAYPEPLPAGRWYHVAATWQTQDGKLNASLYVNGERKATGDGEAKDWQPAETMYMGRLRHAGGTFEGYLDELRISAAPREEFSLEAPPAQDAETLLLAHFDSEGVLDADLVARPTADPKAIIDLPQPLTPTHTSPQGRFGGCLDVRQSPTFRRFDALVYHTAGIIDAKTGTIEVWLRPAERVRNVASGTILDAGPLTLSVSNNLLRFTVAGVTVTARVR